MESEKEQLFSKSDKIALKISVIIILVAGIALAAMSYSGSAEAGEVVQASPAKVVEPRKKALADIYEGAVKDASKVRVESSIEADPVPLVKERTLIVWHPQAEGGESFKARESLKYLLDYYDDNGCTVILNGDKLGFRHKAFVYTVSKADCTLIAVTEVIKDVE